MGVSRRGFIGSLGAAAVAPRLFAKKPSDYDRDHALPFYSYVTLRAAEGSVNPGAVTGPAILATGISTLVGILSCKIAEKWA